MRKPVIAIITNRDLERGYLFPGYPRNTINEDYSRSIAAAGGVPILLAPLADTSVVADQLALADGLLLAGGSDVDVALYGEEPRRGGAGAPQLLRDAAEREALRVAYERNLPVLGICRGLQVLNVWLGGSILQDNADSGTDLQHWSPAGPDEGWHSITVDADSVLGGALGASQLRVNSFHHQSIGRLADGLKAVSHAPDGIIEGAESTTPGGQPVVGVQWHPEMMSRTFEPAQRLFSWFVDACGS